MTNRRSLLMPAAVTSVLLTMTALGQVFVQQRWFVPSVFAVALAFGSGWVARRLDVPGILAPALSLLVMFALLGAVFAPETTAAGLPTAATMQAIGDALGAAMADIRELGPPAEPTDALTLLATAGVFLVAMLVDMLVFWARRPVAAGVPLLALFLIPTSMAKHANVFAFVLAATGYLGILVAEGRDRARAWGRRLSGLDLVDEVADVSHVARVGRRIGSAAVGVALCVPLALPSVGAGILDGNGAGGIFGRGDGDQTAMVFNPIAEIRARIQDDRVQQLFVVDTPSPQYLRLTSLDSFTGEEWNLVSRKVGSDHRVGDDDDDIPTPEQYGQMPAATIRYTVSIGSDLRVNWLPLAYAPRRVLLQDGDWRYEDFGLSVFSADRTSENVTYEADSVIATPTPDQMRAGGQIPKEIAEQYLRLPNGPVPRTAQEVLTRHVDDEPSAYDKAVALNAYFVRSGQFTYSTKVKSDSSMNAIDEFLTKKIGYCEQFAATMAYLARLSGIPARVVVGFTPGTVRDGKYVVTNKDAHAWPELYFPQAGWVRFEPTPRRDIEPPGYAVPPPAAGDPGASGETPGDDPQPTPAASPNQRDRRAADAEQNDVAPTTTVEEGGAPGGGGGVPVAPLAGAAAAVALVTPSLVGFGVRRRRRSRALDPVGRIHAAWESLADAAEDAGHPLRASDSPRGSARRLVATAALTGTVADEVLRLAAAEERARYARTAPPVDGLDAGARTVRQTLLAALPPRARVKAFVFPASSLRRIGEWARAASAGADRRRAAARRRVLRLVPRRRPSAA